MKLNDNWEIRKGPMGNDYALIEKREYFSDKHKEWRISETPRYYPNVKTLVNRLVDLEGMDAVALDTAKDVLSKLEEVKQSILENIKI
jgi:hypothetical protein